MRTAISVPDVPVFDVGEGTEISSGDVYSLVRTTQEEDDVRKSLSSSTSTPSSLCRGRDTAIIAPRLIGSANRNKPAFRTCPLTQLGFVRISCQPKAWLSITLADAESMLQALTALPEHEFWPDDAAVIPCITIVADSSQLTDAYLVAL